MGMITDIAINFAQSNPNKIASILKRLPIPGAQKITSQAVSQAITTGKQILQQNEHSIAGAKKAFSDLGIPPKFLDNVYSIAAPYASKIPGIDPTQAKNMFHEIKSEMQDKIPTAKPESNFNSKKYPKV